MDDLLTPEEMKVAIGLTADDAMIKYAHGLSDFIVVCQAQSAKTKAALVAEGWKSPAEVAKARQGWLYEGRMAEREKMKRFIAQARADERKAIGKWIEHTYPTYGPDYLVPIKDVDALLKGERQ
jgi:hypothetical protein